jgi:hypothetical protein
MISSFKNNSKKTTISIYKLNIKFNNYRTTAKQINGKKKIIIDNRNKTSIKNDLVKSN